VVVALRGAGEAVGPVQPRVEPLRRVRRGDLRGEHVADLVVEGLGVGGRVEVSVRFAPVAPRAGQAVKDLAGVSLASEDRTALRIPQGLAIWTDLGHAGLAEILLGKDVGRDAGPRCGHRDALLAEDRRSVGVLDLRYPRVELDSRVGALA